MSNAITPFSSLQEIFNFAWKEAETRTIPSAIFYTLHNHYDNCFYDSSNVFLGSNEEIHTEKPCLIGAMRFKHYEEKASAYVVGKSNGFSEKQCVLLRSIQDCHDVTINEPEFNGVMMERLRKLAKTYELTVPS